MYYLAIKAAKCVLRKLEKSFNFAKDQAKKILEKKQRDKANQLNALGEMMKKKVHDQRMIIIEKELEETQA
jgi:hypothetical protein